ncbi:MAG: NAD(P)-dependent oxidoreductase [Lachnospiraceae bacterium]|nr:NAD(P)-dependent oxidoreductase [Lachnospiraceae bacterium]
MRVVITGATSFVGAAAVKEMLERGHTVAAVVRPDSKKSDRIIRPNRAALEEGRLIVAENDLGAPECLPGKVGTDFDGFLHFGWGGSGSGARTDRALQEKNLEDSLGAIRAAEKMGCRKFLFSGSQAEYGLHSTLITEESECRPRSLYGEAKLNMRIRGEKLCRELGLQYIHTRIFSAYGPGDHPWTLVESCLDAFLAGETIALGQCTQQWNFIYIEDLARAMCALMEAELTDSNPVYNLAGADTRPLRAFVEEIHRLCGGAGTAAYAARGENAEGVVNLIPDISKVAEATGWRPRTDFQTGIRNMIELRRKESPY